jgi:hypothetical protein
MEDTSIRFHGNILDIGVVSYALGFDKLPGGEPYAFRIEIVFEGALFFIYI